MRAMWHVRSCGLLLLSAIASACTPIEAPISASDLPRPVASPVELVHTVRFLPRSPQLAPGERERLTGFMLSLPAGYLLPPVSDRTAEPVSTDDRLAIQRWQQIVSLLPRARPLSVLPGPSTQVTFVGRPGNEHADTLALHVQTYTVTLPACPDWTRDPANDRDNLGLSNLGCANAVNLGLMIADPADLWLGRPLGPADGMQQADAVTRYRTDKVRPLAAEELQP